MAHSVAVRIWDPRWLTVWLCAFGIPDGSQCVCAHLGSQMAHSVAVRIWDPRWLTVYSTSATYGTSAANESSMWCSETTTNPHWFLDTQAKIVQCVSGGIVNIVGGSSMHYSE
jgi:hypothetical protein